MNEERVAEGKLRAAGMRQFFTLARIARDALAMQDPDGVPDDKSFFIELPSGPHGSGGKRKVVKGRLFPWLFFTVAVPPTVVFLKSPTEASCVLIAKDGTLQSWTQEPMEPSPVVPGLLVSALALLTKPPQP